MKKKEYRPTLLSDDLKEIPDVIEVNGGSRVQLMDHKNSPTRAGTLSEVINKLKQNGGSVAKVVNSPIAKKAAIAAIAGPAGMALNAADAMASVEDIGQGSDEVSELQDAEALMNIPHENFADPEVSEQARRWQKIRGLMEK